MSVYTEVSCGVPLAHGEGYWFGVRSWVRAGTGVLCQEVLGGIRGEGFLGCVCLRSWGYCASDIENLMHHDHHRGAFSHLQSSFILTHLP